MGLSLEETLDLVVRKADDLRAKGVLELTCDGLKLTLAPPSQPAPVAAPAEAPSPPDPLDDPDTFGGSVPQRRGAQMPPDEESEE